MSAGGSDGGDASKRAEFETRALQAAPLTPSDWLRLAPDERMAVLKIIWHSRERSDPSKVWAGVSRESLLATIDGIVEVQRATLGASRAIVEAAGSESEGRANAPKRKKSAARDDALGDASH